MNDVKERRRRAIVELIRSNALSSQEELAQRLADLGFAVTQATISRDLDQIGAVKVRRRGQLNYALPEHVTDPSAPPLDAALRQWVRSIDTAVNLVLLRTPPGCAHLVGVLLDQSGIDQIVGTICGDDTIFVACRSAHAAEELASTLKSLT